MNEYIIITVIALVAICTIVCIVLFTLRHFKILEKKISIMENHIGYHENAIRRIFALSKFPSLEDDDVEAPKDPPPLPPANESPSREQQLPTIPEEEEEGKEEDLDQEIIEELNELAELGAAIYHAHDEGSAVQKEDLPVIVPQEEAPSDARIVEIPADEEEINVGKELFGEDYKLLEGSYEDYVKEHERRKKAREDAADEKIIEEEPVTPLVSENLLIDEQDRARAASPEQVRAEKSPQVKPRRHPKRMQRAEPDPKPIA